MINILINNIEIPLGNIWYNKRKYIGGFKEYRIILDLKKAEVIEFLEGFTERKYKDMDFFVLTKKRDSELGSMGIIRSLISYFDKYENLSIEDPNKPYHMLNSVDRIYKDNDILIIEGKIENKVWN